MSMPSPTSAPKLRVVAGNGNRQLAERVATQLMTKLTPCEVNTRSCGEVVLSVSDDVRGADVYLIQPTCGHDDVELNQTVLELLFLVRRLKQKGAASITALVPFFAYARQDRKSDLRSPISAAAVSRMVDRMGVDRIVTLDVHSGQIQGYFNARAPLDNLGMALEFAQYVRTCRWFKPSETVVVSPDAGGVARAHAFADLLGVSHIVTVMKRRAAAGVVSSMQTVGDVKGYTCIIVDDMIDTGGTLVAACGLLKSLGATKVVACITHGILTDPCIDRVNGSDALDDLIISDSMPQEKHQQRCPKLQVIGIAPLLAQAISKYHTGGSISELFRRPSTPMPQPLSGPSRSGGATATNMSPLEEREGSFPASKGATPGTAGVGVSPKVGGANAAGAGMLPPSIAGAAGSAHTRQSSVGTASVASPAASMHADPSSPDAAVRQQ